MLHWILMHPVLWSILLLSTYSPVKCLPARAVLMNAEPVKVDVRRVYYASYHPLNKRKLSPSYQSPPPTHDDDYYYEPTFAESESFSIGPDDAINNHKFSPPIDMPQPGRKRNSRGEYDPPNYRQTASTHRDTYISPSDMPFRPSSGPPSSIPHILGTHSPSWNRQVHPSVLSTVVTETTVTSDYQIDPESYIKSEKPEVLNSTYVQNNFTISTSNQSFDESDIVLRYERPPPNLLNHRWRDQGTNDTVYRVPNSTRGKLLNGSAVSFDDIDGRFEKDISVDGMVTSVELGDHQVTTRTIYRSVDDMVTLPPSVNYEKDNNSVMPPSESTKQYKFSSGAVAGIVVAVLVSVTFVTSSVIYLLYRRYNGQCTSVVEGKFNSDNCGYLDDSLRSSVYLNNHIELPKENSEEMSSLDNDSFLNSLETMTIQNYWADSTKNTKV